MKEHQFIDKLEKGLTQNGIEPDLIDSKSLFDNALTTGEQTSQIKAIIQEQTGSFSIDKKQVEAQRKEYIENLIETQEYAYNNSELLYKDLYMSIEKLIKGYSALLMIKGTAGTGKSFQINNALKKNNAEFVIVRDTTEAYLPQLLYENNGKIIWLQDCAYKLLRGVGTIEILKSISETDPKMRIVNNYNYNPQKSDIPKSFIFSGKLILDFNKIVDLKYLDNYNALVSRSDFIELVFSRQEIVNIMNEIATEPWQKDVTEYLISVLSDMTALNLRTQANAFRDYQFCQETKYDWKTYILKRATTKSPIFNLLYQYMGKEPKRTTELKRWLISTQNMSIRQAERRIKEYVEIGELINIEPMRERDYLVSLFPIKEGMV